MSFHESGGFGQHVFPISKEEKRHYANNNHLLWQWVDANLPPDLKALMQTHLLVSANAVWACSVAHNAFEACAMPMPDDQNPTNPSKN